MSSQVDDVVVCYQQLVKEWQTKGPNYIQKCGQLLNKLKIGLTQCQFMPVTGLQASKRELLVARDILEIGAQWSCASEDIPAFERYMSMLKTYYMDYKNDLPESSYKYQLLGLNLLYLLSQNRVAEFHTELELLPAREIQTNIHISHPVSLEQFLMEGSYNKIFLSKENVPAASYTYFMEILLNTVRDEIASCAEKTYEKISPSEMARMLYFDSSKQAEAYLSKRGWKLKGGNLYVLNSPSTKPTEDLVPANDFASKTIEYAREMEQIV